MKLYIYNRLINSILSQLPKEPEKNPFDIKRQSDIWFAGLHAMACGYLTLTLSDMHALRSIILALLMSGLL